MNVVFFGSTEFALPTLEAIYQHFTLRLVVTHSDTKRGRGQKLAIPQAKAFAKKHRIPTLQPQILHGGAARNTIAKHKPSFLVVVDYGKKIPNDFIALPRLATLNLHPSLLPRHRGPSPIPYTILSGDPHAGNSIIGLTDEMDAGPIYAQQKTSILPGETAADLSRRLALSGAELMIHTLERVARENLAPVEQNHSEATQAPKLNKADGKLDFSRPAKELERRVRAMQPWPKAYCTLPVATPQGSLRVNILRCTCENESSTQAPGTVARVDKTGVWIVASDALLKIVELQPAGKRAQTVADFTNGYKVIVGSIAT